MRQKYLDDVGPVVTLLELDAVVVGLVFLLYVT